MGGARRGATRGRRVSKRVKARRLGRSPWAHSKAVTDLPKVDITNRGGKECVLLLMAAPFPDGHMFWPPVLAWYPEEQLVGIVSNKLLPPKFIPMASSSGMLCGLHMDDILSDGFEWPPDCWLLRAAVCNPATGFQYKLPVLKMEPVPHEPASAHAHGLVRLAMTGDQEQFSVHLLCTRQGRHSVYTWRRGCQDWKASSGSGELTGNLAGEFVFRDVKLQAYDTHADSWTAMPIPGAKAWNDFPLPQGLEGYSYDGVHAFRYGHKVMVAGLCFRKEPGAAVVLEVPQGAQEAEEGGHQCKPVAWATADQFADNPIPVAPQYFAEWPLHGGDLLVIRQGSTFSEQDETVAFHLKHHTWLELPRTSVAHLTPQPVCIYIPQEKRKESQQQQLLNEELV